MFRIVSRIGLGLFAVCGYYSQTRPGYLPEVSLVVAIHCAPGLPVTAPPSGREETSPSNGQHPCEGRPQLLRGGDQSRLAPPPSRRGFFYSAGYPVLRAAR